MCSVVSGQAPRVCLHSSFNRDTAGLDCVGQCLVVALVQVRVGDREVGNGTVEGVALAEV